MLYTSTRSTPNGSAYAKVMVNWLLSRSVTTTNKIFHSKYFYNQHNSIWIASWDVSMQKPNFNFNRLFYLLNNTHLWLVRCFRIKTLTLSNQPNLDVRWKDIYIYQLLFASASLFVYNIPKPIQYYIRCHI